MAEVHDGRRSFVRVEGYLIPVADIKKREFVVPHSIVRIVAVREDVLDPASPNLFDTYQLTRIPPALTREDFPKRGGRLQILRQELSKSHMRGKTAEYGSEALR